MRTALPLAGLALALAVRAGAQAASRRPPLALAGTVRDCSYDFVSHFYDGPAKTKRDLAYEKLTRHLLPVEVELIWEAKPDAIDSGGGLAAALRSAKPGSLGAKLQAALAAYERGDRTADAKAAAFVAALRPGLRRLAQIRAEHPALGPNLSTLGARLLICRYSHLHKQAELESKLAAAKDPAAALKYWAGYVRDELSDYAAHGGQAPAVVDYTALYGQEQTRALAALNGFSPDAAPASPAAPQAGPAAAGPAVKPAPGDPTSLTDAERQELPTLLRADYLAERGRLARLDGTDAQKLTADLTAVTGRYRGILEMRRGLDDKQRAQFDGELAATARGTAQDRDAVIEKYRKFSKAERAKDQLSSIVAGHAESVIDGNVHQGAVSATGPGGKDLRTDAERKAEDAARASRDNAENVKSMSGTDNAVVPPTMGAAADVDPDAAKAAAKKAKEKTWRDGLAGAKLGLWGAVLGALLMGPAGLILMGGAAFAAGFFINRINNDGV